MGLPGRKRKHAEEAPPLCPYLDTVQRSLLDFDFEPSCSVSLQSGPHIYGCLVCGKFFRGRGPSTPAYTHSVQDGHFVFVHLTSAQFYCLPDNYPIHDASLLDIAAALSPTYTTAEVSLLDSNTKLARDLFGRSYLPGFVGLNNLNKTDCINACVQALAHVPPLRDLFLTLPKPQDALANNNNGNKSNKSNKSKASSKLVSGHRMAVHVTQCFAELVRKLWSDKRFKNHIDPHMLTQAIAVASRNRFRIGRQMDAGDFIAWFLHQLHQGLGGKSSRPKSSPIHTIFQGSVQVTTRQIKKDAVADTQQLLQAEDRLGSEDEEEEDESSERRSGDKTQQKKLETEEIVTESQFLHLTLDISQKPLFRNEDGGLVIPQEPLVTVLKKFDGVSFLDAVSRSGDAQQRRYRIRKLPPYLILHLARFQSNRFLKEKNHTIVPFPVRNLDLSNYVFSNHTSSNDNKAALPTEEQVRAMSVSSTVITSAEYRQLMMYRKIISDLTAST
jgi:U4/U6.U5 tri-snRNP-associated protein 2